jgi:hypothetical protein
MQSALSLCGVPGLWVDLIHSPHDGGWYAEVIDTKGQTIYTTMIGTRAAVRRTAIRWCKANAARYAE